MSVTRKNDFSQFQKNVTNNFRAGVITYLWERDIIMTQSNIVYTMCHIWQIFEKSSLEAPVATGIGMDNPDNIPGKYVMPGVPAVTSR